jgi:hypothetical protein
MHITEREKLIFSIAVQDILLSDKILLKHKLYFPYKQFDFIEDLEHKP